ncbi:MAG: STAS domain-containing protein [Clostridiales bacterium]|nr:STAS domain-containing protein [Clostridiales bacterium]
MHIDFIMTDNILIAAVKGDIDHHNAKFMREEIDRTYEVFSGKHIILDFSGVPFVDSSGIGMILGRYNVVKENGGKLIICGVSEYMRKILHMSGIFTIIQAYESVSEAINIIKEEYSDGMTDYENHR